MSQSPVNTLRRKKKLAPAPPAGCMAQKMSFLHSNNNNVNNNNNGDMNYKQYSHYPVNEKDKLKGGANKKSKAPKPPLQIKMNQAPPPPQQQLQQATSFSSGLDISNDHDNRTKQSSVKLERDTRQVLEETNISSNSKDEKASNVKSSPKMNGNKSIQKSKKEDKEPKQAKTSNRSIDENKIKSSLDVARKCRNDFPPFLTSAQEKSTSVVSKTTTSLSPKLPQNNQSGVPEFQTLTLRKTPKGKTQSNDPRFIPVKSPREELLSSIQNMGGPKTLKTVQGSSASNDKRFNTVDSPRENLLSSIRDSQGLKSLKPIQESVTQSPNVCNNGPPPPPPPVPATKQPTASQSSKFKTNVDPRDDLLSAIRNSGGVKSLKPVKR